MHWAQSSFVDQCGDRCMNPVFRLGMLQRKVMQLLSHSLVSFCHEVLPAGSQMEPTQPHTGTRLKEESLTCNCIETNLLQQETERNESTELGLET